MRLKWIADPDQAANHWYATTRFGTYRMGPRKSDGCWEYCTPDDDWGQHNNHTAEDLSLLDAHVAILGDFHARLRRAGTGAV